MIDEKALVEAVQELRRTWSAQSRHALEVYWANLGAERAAAALLQRIEQLADGGQDKTTASQEQTEEKD